ncbi:unnamed protein product [Ambrosiozyma monospora]|uniref:Unnamed protein product n=1 Tax=Ambrosiozyma monospora TaxID=43982 RepID=A0ACB5TB88_AMBMO|nr:unnamed protein product [Ambrosiozyma monospora]
MACSLAVLTSAPLNPLETEDEEEDILVLSLLDSEDNLDSIVGRTKTPFRPFGWTQLKYLIPLIDPSFLPLAANCGSSSIPIHSPPLNWV